MAEISGPPFNREKSAFGNLEKGAPKPTSLEAHEYAALWKNKQVETIRMTPDEYIDRAVKGFNEQLSPEHVRKYGGFTKESLLASRDVNLAEKYAQKMAAGAGFEVPYLDYSGGNFSQEGLHRAMAAKKLGLKAIPVQIVKDAALTPRQRALLLAKDFGKKFVGRLIGAALGPALNVQAAAEAGWGLGRALGQTPLLTDPTTTYDQFYENAFRQRILANAAQQK